MPSLREVILTEEAFYYRENVKVSSRLSSGYETVDVSSFARFFL